MIKRILIGAVLGSILLFVWGTLSHMVLQLGSVGVKALPKQEALMPALRDNITEPGFYLFPCPEDWSNMTSEQEQKWAEQHRRGPVGVLIYRPEGGEPMSVTLLLTEFVTDFHAALIAAILLALASKGLARYFGRVLFVALLGLLTGVMTDVQYWNWYGFPGDYTLAQIADQVIGFTLVGLVLAAIVKRPSPESPPTGTA